MVNPTLTYDNEYNRRLREILTNYDDVEASRNSPTMITGGMRLQSHTNAGTTPYDGREGTAPFSNTITGGVRHPRMIEDIFDTLPPITDMRYRGRVPKMPSNAQIMSAYSNAMKGGEMIGGNDAKFWGKFALDTGIKAYRLKNQFDNLMGRGAVGGNRRANTKEDAVFWRDFAENTANSMANLGDKAKKLFGGKKGKGGFLPFMPKQRKSPQEQMFSNLERGINSTEEGRSWNQSMEDSNRRQREAWDAEPFWGGNRRANTKEDAVFWRDFADNTANSMVSLGDKAKKLFGGRGRGKRANRKEDAVFWRDFADNTANSMVNLGEKTKKLFGGKKGGVSMNDIIRYSPKIMAYNAINNATGRHLPGLFGGEQYGSGLPKKVGRSARGAIVSQVMKEHGLSLPMASKFVKENGLY